MIIYNTVMGVAAGLALIMVPLLARNLYMRKSVSGEGWALSFGVLGFILALLGGLMSTTHPLFVNPPINIVFGEPTFFLGLLLLAAAIFLWARRDVIADVGSSNKKVSDDAYMYIKKVAAPVSWVVFGLGLILLSCTLAILRFELVGGAPPIEPITGNLSGHPAVENTFFVLLYGLPAIGCLLVPRAVRNLAGKAGRIVLWTFMISGVAFLLFGAMNYYTHVGLQINQQRGTNYKW
jgi:hypothetical protein